MIKKTFIYSTFSKRLGSYRKNKRVIASATIMVWIFGFLASLPVILRTVYRKEEMNGGKSRETCGIVWHGSYRESL